MNEKNIGTIKDSYIGRIWEESSDINEIYEIPTPFFDIDITNVNKYQTHSMERQYEN